MTRIELSGTEQINAFVRDHGGIRSLDEAVDGDNVVGDIAIMVLADGARLFVRMDGVTCGGESSWNDEVRIEWYGVVP